MPPDACARMRVGACAQNAFNLAQRSQHVSGVALCTSAQTYGSLLLSMASPSKKRHLSLSLSHLLASISQAAAANVTAGLKWAPETDANE